ncbi:hypothetical protein CAEBREN_15357 [Caenorhabditis brenneri]|uniref:Sdz-33 F-box domain-containing protein n=1 Tax=Caenorhabditis brenneri TaxID=135651 RepID=G0MFC1_CAEBE|nr:hypothetical protein CAEBREN_15357 [Caenorhabditis brenneri]
MKEKVKMNRYTVVNRYFMRDSTDTTQNLCLQFNKLELTFCLLFSDPDEKKVHKCNSFNHNINGITYNFRTGFNSIYVGKTTDVAVMFNLIEYTLNLFRISLDGIWVDTTSVSSMQQLACHPSVQTIPTVFVGGESFSSSKLFELFNNLKGPLLRAYVLAPVEGDVDVIQNLFGAENVYIKKSGWLRKEHLLGSNSRFILLKESNLKEDTLVSFVERWLNGSETRLETMIVYFAADNKIDKELISNSLGGEPWDPAKRSQKFLAEGLWIREIVEGAWSLYSDCEKGLDIERNDGLLATVKVDEQGYGFFFHVWHKRFH